MILYRTKNGWVVEREGQVARLAETSLDALLVREDLQAYLESVPLSGNAAVPDTAALLAPVGSQEIWAAGVTYFRSRVARMEESEQGGNFYDRVYTADRPELFMKCLPWKAVGSGAPVAIRKDATWSVPEPELVLVIDPRGKIVGFTIGNDMSSRDIEGENPLYLPQAKIYDGSCAIGPGILVSREPLPPSTRITLNIERDDATAFAGETALSEMKRRPEELVEFLYRDQTFRSGCFLFTGTGVVPPDSFTLKAGDTIQIGIEGIGVLVNEVGQPGAASR
ncbi:MAG TPA: fumarylacetoacetate hydrolase family protein [Acidobacteriaceae bacterium]|nr:fumarylacetoacetate hydrolase family protein [Acidobacteriaceae bacterium]